MYRTLLTKSRHNLGSTVTTWTVDARRHPYEGGVGSTEQRKQDANRDDPSTCQTLHGTGRDGMEGRNDQAARKTLQQLVGILGNALIERVLNRDRVSIRCSDFRSLSCQGTPSEVGVGAQNQGHVRH